MDKLKILNLLLSLIALFFIALMLKLAQPIILTILIAVLLAYIMDPMITLFKRFKIPLFIAVPVTALVSLSVFTGFGIIIYTHLLDFAREFPGYQAKFMIMVNDILSRIQFEGDEIIKTNILNELRGIPIGSIILSTAGSIANFITNFIVIFLFAILILLGKYNLTRKLLSSFPRNSGKRIAAILNSIDRGLRKYIGIKTAMSLCVGISSGICLFLFRVEFAIIFGFLTVVLNFIPYLGSSIAVILPSLIALIQFGALGKPLWILLILILLQNLVGYVLEPRIVGKRLNLSITIVFFSLLFWGWLWGAAGVLLAVPMTTSIKIVLENIPICKPFALLLERAARKKNQTTNSV